MELLKQWSTINLQGFCGVCLCMMDFDGSSNTRRICTLVMVMHLTGPIKQFYWLNQVMCKYHLLNPHV